MYQFGPILKRAVNGIRRRPWLHLLSVLTLAAAFTSFAATLTAAINLDTLVGRWVGTGELTVYLNEYAEPGDLERLADAIAATEGVARVDRVPPALARKRFAAGLGEFGDLARGLPVSSFPASLEIHLAPGPTRDQQARHALASRLGQVDMIEEIEIYDDWFGRLSAISLIGRVTAWGLGLVALIVALLVVAAAVRAGVNERRREIEVLRVVGATDTYVRLPFLIEGALEAGLAMAIALFVLNGVVGQVEELAREVLPLVGASAIARLDLTAAAALLMGSIVAGVVGARLSMRRLQEI